MFKNSRLNKNTISGLISYAIVIAAFAIIMPLQSAGMLTNAISGQLVPICAYIVMAISLNLTVGILGELSLGHAGFMSVGAFSGVIISAQLADSISFAPLRLAISIVVGAIFAGIVGLLVGLPILRLRGDYLAIVTLAFGEIIKNLINCLYVGLDGRGLHIGMKDIASLGMKNGKVIINGPQGALGIERISSFTSGVVLILITLFIVLNLINSRSGRAIKAIRDNRIAAESVGIGITRYKLVAFITSAALAGAAGAYYAMNFSMIAAKKFDFNTSILVLVFVVLGGMGNITGSIIATTVLYMLPELLREFADYRMLIYAIILIAVMLITNNKQATLFLKNITGAIKKLFGNIFSGKNSGGSDGGKQREAESNE